MTPAINSNPPAPGPDSLPNTIGGDEFQDAYGESLEQALNLATWHGVHELGRFYRELEAHVAAAIARESNLRTTIRNEILPRIANRPGAPSGAGLYQVTRAQMEHALRALLFAGRVEACDGAVVTHDTLALTITRIDVCLVKYHGESTSWVHRLYRRDLRGQLTDPMEEALDLIERRQRHTGSDQPDLATRLSELARRGIVAYAERTILLEQATSDWRMGHGSPAPFELLTGSGSMPLLQASLGKLATLIGEHRKFVFVPTAPRDRGLLTIGHALRDLEYVVLDTMETRMEAIVDGGHYATKDKMLVRAFVADYGPRIVIGLYRISENGPPRLFYAHPDHVHTAALIAMADSSLQEHRAFPTLLELAATVCHTSFAAGDFTGAVRQAYAETGQPFRYLGDAETWH